MPDDARSCLPRGPQARRRLTISASHIEALARPTNASVTLMPLKLTVISCIGPGEPPS
jgi:hypothetical protein